MHTLCIVVVHSPLSFRSVSATASRPNTFRTPDFIRCFSSKTSCCHKSSSSNTGCLHATHALHRPQAVKPNPFHTQSGKFDQSFEKMTERIESRMPMRERHVISGSIYDCPFGEESEEAMKRAAHDDVFGSEPEKPAARLARSYFTDADLSPEALHARSPRLKVAQNIQRQHYDKSILKTSSEPASYYYTVESVSDKRRRGRRLGIVWLVIVIAAMWQVYRVAIYMRDGD